MLSAENSLCGNKWIIKGFLYFTIYLFILHKTEPGKSGRLSGAIKAFQSKRNQNLWFPLTPLIQTVTWKSQTPSIILITTLTPVHLRQSLILSRQSNKICYKLYFKACILQWHAANLPSKHSRHRHNLACHCVCTKDKVALWPVGMSSVWWWICCVEQMSELINFSYGVMLEDVNVQNQNLKPIHPSAVTTAFNTEAQSWLIYWKYIIYAVFKIYLPQNIIDIFHIFVLCSHKQIIIVQYV